MANNYHPVSHRKAAIFHGKLASIGLLHILAGVGMIWFHLTASRNHWLDRLKD